MERGQVLALIRARRPVSRANLGRNSPHRTCLPYRRRRIRTVEFVRHLPSRLCALHSHRFRSLLKREEQENKT